MNLVWFWCDGMFASASDNIVITYLTIYLLALGASQSQIGIMSSLSSLASALVLMPGAMLAERSGGNRRRIVLTGSGWNRFALLLIALAPLIFQAPGVIFVVMALSITRDAAANIIYPGWMAMTGDVVPLEGRGRFFSSRNFIMGLSGIVVTLLAGFLISSMHPPIGYQISLAAACLLGGLSLFSFSHIADRPRAMPYPQVQEKFALGPLLRDIAGNRDFAVFAATTALWNFSLNIAGPFFTVYLVKGLQANATMVAVTTVASSVSAILVQRKAGELNDRWGARRLTTICGLLIPIVPLMWVFATAAWNVIIINLFSGALWAGYNLGAFNYLLSTTPVERRARFSAVFQITVTLSLALGAALGSLMISVWGFKSVFIWSAVGRMVAALLFVWLYTHPPVAKPASDTAG
jgi:MFS family permease